MFAVLVQRAVDALGTPDTSLHRPRAHAAFPAAFRYIPNPHCKKIRLITRVVTRVGLVVTTLV